MEINSLRELYIDQLRDLYDAENQLIKALPKMAKGATSDQLREGIEEHLEQTRGQAERLEQIFERLGEKPKGKKCKGMQGLVEEGNETLKEDMEEDTKDAAIIAAAQRVEHYEISGYGTARTYANLLGENEDAMRTHILLAGSVLLLALSSVAQDAKSAFCNFDDDNQVSIQYSSVVKDPPRNGKVWSPGVRNVTAAAKVCIPRSLAWNV